MTLSTITRILHGTPDQPTLSFARDYAFSPADLWSALTDATRLSRWFGHFDGPAPQRVGDTFVVDLGGGDADRATGTVTTCEPEHSLSYGWQRQDERPSQVQVTLEPNGAGTRLRLRHTLAEPDHVVGYGGGWEQMLMALDDELTGTTTTQSTHEAVEQEGNRAWGALLSEAGQRDGAVDGAQGT